MLINSFLKVTLIIFIYNIGNLLLILLVVNFIIYKNRKRKKTLRSFYNKKIEKFYKN